MPKTFAIPFTKLHGLGNDFILAHSRGLPRSLPALARSITDRHTGVGADGFIIVLPPRDKHNRARVRFFNADGSEPEMSGNGIRCAAAFLLAEGKSRGGAKIETVAGVKTLELLGAADNRWIFRVRMGAPILAPASIPFVGGDLSAPIVGFPLPTNAGVFPVTVTSMGNPHCTVFVKDFAALDWAAVGREIERSAHFPHRTNAEFVKVISRRIIEVRFWERGVGVTNSSGTGSCGATVSCILNGFTDRTVSVRTVAGNLEIAWPEGGEVFLTGPVVRVSSGNYYYRAGVSSSAAGHQ
ncbi:MAG TPA: diaminopimelate epimerase [Terriglobia bacterium]|nr:diaminopimelate epimerase [Terriglobia bacterium]